MFGRKRKNPHANWHTHFERPAEFGRCLLFTPCSKELPFKREATLLWEFSWRVNAATSKRSYISGKTPSKYRNCSCPQYVNTWLLFFKAIQITEETSFHNINVHMRLWKKCWDSESTFKHCPQAKRFFTTKAETLICYLFSMSVWKHPFHYT